MIREVFVVDLATTNAEGLFNHCLILFVFFCSLNPVGWASFLAGDTVLTGGFLSLSHVLGTSSGHFSDRLFELLDIFKFVIGLPALAVLLLKLIFLVVVFLGVLSIDFGVRVALPSAIIILLIDRLVWISDLSWPFQGVIHFTSCHCGTDARDVWHFVLILLNGILGRRRSLLWAWSFATLST